MRSLFIGGVTAFAALVCFQLFLAVPAFAADVSTVKTWIASLPEAGPHTRRFEFVLERPASVRLRYGKTIHLE